MLLAALLKIYFLKDEQEVEKIDNISKYIALPFVTQQFY